MALNYADVAATTAALTAVPMAAAAVKHGKLEASATIVLDEPMMRHHPPLLKNKSGSVTSQRAVTSQRTPCWKLKYQDFLPNKDLAASGAAWDSSSDRFQ